jgi:DNA-binding transcriptional LysR family regulator
VRHLVFASRDYLKKHGTPQKPEDLDKHRLVVYGGDSRPPVRYVNWLMEAGARDGFERRPILTVNNLHGIFRAVESGLGIGAMPDFMEWERTDLVRILPELQGPEIEAYFVYPEELRSSKRIAVFRDFLLRKVAEGRNS